MSGNVMLPSVSTTYLLVNASSLKTLIDNTSEAPILYDRLNADGDIGGAAACPGAAVCAATKAMSESMVYNRIRTRTATKDKCGGDRSFSPAFPASDAWRSRS